MIVSNSSALKSRWVDYPNDPHGARFEITIVEREKSRNIDEKTQRVSIRNGEACIEINTTLAASLTASAAMTGWENVFDTEEDKKAGKEMKVTPSNKQKLFNGDEKLEAWVLSEHQKLKEEREAQLEEERKNSES